MSPIVMDLNEVQPQQVNSANECEKGSGGFERRALLTRSYSLKSAQGRHGLLDRATCWSNTRDRL